MIIFGLVAGLYGFCFLLYWIAIVNTGKGKPGW